MQRFGTFTVFDLLIKYITEGRIRLDRSRFKGVATYHDPCNYTRNAEKKFGHGYYEEPRWIMDHCVEEWVDLYPDRHDQFCCGGGGGALTTGYNPERIFYGRRKIEQIRASGANTVVVPCHSCHSQIHSLKEEYHLPHLEVKYLWELVADCLVV
ncbi:MAG: heterodisulfide reductase-related iron-sulfur binding cluster [Desulfobacterales bacterium]|nr:heterodisulfide reductase-related iron-sulfur binding cluster [Desulfobacterales bacterium]